MSTLTKEEKAWLLKLQRLLNACPSERMGFYTTGDRTVSIYDKSLDVDEMHQVDSEEFGGVVDKLDARLGQIEFPALVHSVAG